MTTTALHWERPFIICHGRPEATYSQLLHALTLQLLVLC